MDSNDNGKIDKLEQLLEIADFNGGCKTFEKLIFGSIKDFNVMTNQTNYHAKIKTYSKLQKVTSNHTDTLLMVK